MQKFIFLSLIIITGICIPGCKSETKDTEPETVRISNTLDSFHLAAAKAEYSNYFNFFGENAVFTGTDASERWDKTSFMQWAKPIFDKGKAWNFTALQRNIYTDKTGSVAWFDELLNTQMKICRGSGVMVKEGSQWKVQQYILSTTIPNDYMDSIIKIKAPIENELIRELMEKKNK